MEKLWTTTEVAEFLGINDVDVEELVRQGTLTGYKLGGRFLRFRPDQVEALKGTLRFRPTLRKPLHHHRGAWLQRMRDFFYFYDFYLISALCLTGLVLYLLMASG